MNTQIDASNFLRSLRDRFAPTLYIAGTSLLLIGTIVTAKSDFSALLWTTVSGLGMVALTIGFLLRFQTVFLVLWGSWIGKLATLAYSALAAVVAIIPAKHIVGDALQLQPTDFPITLGLWTLC
ncbi:hypothetical protein WQE_51402 [Paraburkholderia hospita]|uniref:Uncharacterized protein n=1 Tax=Paraburkholderia hospita TaxID=169430 RepID=A0ABN0F3M8_9BURK|nr:hypothetical protein [Paraburkholderia hospita]EIM93076.1 hypothetical protein WQE_51402 [Paraburkholderia hospita]OUL82645.1 hypothetical protein CA602_23800 [Paraburkholderia hospita]